MVIMQGDSLSVRLSLSDGEKLLSPEQLEDVEVCVGNKSRRYLYSAGEIEFDDAFREFKFRMDQKETFSMQPGLAPVIARVKFRNAPDFDVRGIHCGSIDVKKTISTEVL